MAVLLDMMYPCVRLHALFIKTFRVKMDASYTNGSICTADQELLFFGGGMWDHHQAISSYSVDSNYGNLIKRVTWDVKATLSGYEVKKLLLGHRHAIVVVGKMEARLREHNGAEESKAF